MTKLSVNINKIATLRNARGGNTPNLLKMAEDIQRFGADGITIHPRPDERHIRYKDAIDLGLVSPCSALRGLYSTPSKSANLCTPSSPPGGH